MLDKYDTRKIDSIEHNGISMTWLYSFGSPTALSYCDFILPERSHWCCVTDWGTENYTGPLLPPSGSRITVYSHGHCVYRSITFIPPANWSCYFTLFNFICKTVFAVCKQNRISDSYYLHDLLLSVKATKDDNSKASRLSITRSLHFL